MPPRKQATVTGGRTALFVVAAPHQLLNVAEARAVFALPDCTLLILTDTYPAAAFLKMIDVDEWSSILTAEEQDDVEIADLRSHRLLSIIPLLARLSGDIARRRRVDKLTAFLATQEWIFLGNYSPLFRHLVNLNRRAKVVLLDDGTDTLVIDAQRKSRLAGHLVSRLSAARASLRTRAIGLRAQDPAAVTFFTAYDIVPSPADSMIPNNYGVLRSTAANSSVADEVYILGQPLVEDGLMQEATYSHYITTIGRSFTSQRVFYVPHKRESAAHVAELSSQLDMPLRRFETPIEHALAHAPTRPKVIASLYSSALDTCRVIFADTLTIESFEIRPQDLLKDHAIVADIYSYLRTKASPTFRVLSIDEAATPGSSGARQLTSAGADVTSPVR